MKNLSIFYFFVSILLFSCNNNARIDASKNQNNDIEIPQLLDRAEALRYGKEWDDVQNFYGTQMAELRRNPKNVEARLKLAECFIQEARITGEHPHYYPAALKVLEGAITELTNMTNPTPQQKDHLFRALSHKASVQLSLHDFAAARQTAEQAVAINPYNAYIYGCLVDAHVELGQYQKAVEVCDKMVSIRPDLRSYSRVSYLRELHGDLNGAIEAMDMAVKAGFPGYEQTEWARLQLGYLYAKKGDWNTAEAQFNASLATRPDYPFALAALAEVAMHHNQVEKAENLLNKAIAIIPEVGFKTDLAKIYQKTGRNEAAQAAIESIITMMAEDTQAGHNMALEAGRFHLEVTGDLQQAMIYAEQELAARPDNIEVNRLIADIYLKQGKKAEAAIYQRKIKLT
jgi:pentatricopeptide repeat protein